MMAQPAGNNRPEPKKKVGKTRRVVGFVVFLVLIGVFTFVMIDRIRNPEVIIVPNEEDAWDDSLAEARAGRRTGRGADRKARRNRVLDAYNRLGDEVDRLHAEWKAALACQPSGTISRRDAFDFELRVRDAYPRLDRAENVLRDIEDRVATMRLALDEAATETEADRIERMYVAAEELAGNLAEKHLAIHELLEALEEEMSLFDEGEDYSAERAVTDAAKRRLTALSSAVDRCLGEMEKAADAYFN